jgi:hypothetical protein
MMTLSHTSHVAQAVALAVAPSGVDQHE